MIFNEYTTTCKPGMKNRMKHILIFPVFILILLPLITRNKKLRYKSAMNKDNKHPDQWYWADLLAVDYGYFVGFYHE